MRYYTTMLETNGDPSLGQRNTARGLGLAQGAYFAATGLWALLDIQSFQWVTGPKVDLWLVKTVGVLVLAIGITLVVAAARRRVPAELALLAILSAAGLGTIDLYYVARGRISGIYGLDALAEGLLVILWVRALRRPPRVGRNGIPISMTSASAGGGEHLDYRFVARGATGDKR